ncbi:peroxisomal d3,d2-enoyl-CoA isomeras-like protein [Coleophoma crateriformis]|uniref:Peroxisomal d3,d2-enoyl-CoA isomeras-like protein n=1 Tax=Coleophoma crateriformis TaxID=565419 RepID=A0A3D8QEQ0_9HELO|nr:peroxisomal d3,d2-enoyl-CoA isomeras-like protein [Coleophoma crateriformis]
MATTKYEDIVVTNQGKIGIIKLNRPKALNSFGGKMIPEVINAIRELNDDPSTVFTVLTGEGSGLSTPETYSTTAEKKLAFLGRFMPALELLRSMIDHKKVFVLALNGPAVGGGAAWFAGIADIMLASSSTYIQVPFSALGLVPENGSALSFSQQIGVRRAHNILTLGDKVGAQELENWGMINRIFPLETFHEDMVKFLEELLQRNDGGSMCESKRLMNEGFRDARMLAVLRSMDALAERFVDGVPFERFELKRRELEEKSKQRQSSKL